MVAQSLKMLMLFLVVIVVEINIPRQLWRQCLELLEATQIIVHFSTLLCKQKVMGILIVLPEFDWIQ